MNVNPFANPFARRQLKFVEPVTLAGTPEYDGWSRRWTIRYTAARHAVGVVEKQFARGKLVTVEGQSLVIESSTISFEANEEGRLTATVVAASVTDILAGAGTPKAATASGAHKPEAGPGAPILPAGRRLLL